MDRLFFLIFTTFIFFCIDFYAFQAFKMLSPAKWLSILYWSISGLVLLLYVTYHITPHEAISKGIRQIMLAIIFVNYFSKFFGAFFMMLDDLLRAFKWIGYKVGLYVPDSPKPGKALISRSEFLAKTAVGATLVPAATMAYGIISGAHDYRLRRVKLAIKNLPKGFEGMTIGQVSDIHSGSFFNKTAVKGGVEMLLNAKPDLVFFTGDLVNNTADEVKEYVEIFEKIKAPLGVFSTLGNHDYGDYVQWDSKQKKVQNLKDLIQTHKNMGWDILMDENRTLKVGHDELAIVGIQNWGAGERWPKYGNLKKALEGTEDQEIKLLLSHDPSHWDAQVKGKHTDIQAMFSGHTHGMQFGIETELFRWSPSQYAYKQWAGLYKEGDQNLYVNRGYGYLGYPGRVGILPEITIFELCTAS